MRKAWPKYLILVVLVGVLAVGVAQQQALADWLKLRDYQPPASITQLADDTTMTAAARHLFYLNRPNLADKADFKGQCPNDGEETIVLGCYHAGENGIAILQVSDARLQGVEQVTAAHEMLHAAYERLSAADKRTLNSELQAYYDHGLTDQRIKDTLKAYLTSEPGQQLNEMHSIFGTEVANLPATLSAHYAHYFSNRQAVTDDAAHYQAAFTSRKQQVQADDAHLRQWKTQLDQATADLKARDAALKAQSTQMEQLRDNGNIAAYNAQVSGYNGRVAAYNDAVASAKNLLAQYNQLVESRNAIALEEQQLQASLDGTVPAAR